MITCICLLKGINVGGFHKVKMDTLKQAFSDLGFSNISTYIQSGNVVFRSKNENINELSNSISEKLAKTFQFEIPVILISNHELKKIITENPFILKDKFNTDSLYVTILKSTPANENINQLMEDKKIEGKFYIVDKAVYLFCPDGYSNCKLNNTFIERKLKVTATSRNWKTLTELLKISENSENNK